MPSKIARQKRNREIFRLRNRQKLSFEELGRRFEITPLHVAIICRAMAKTEALRKNPLLTGIELKREVRRLLHLTCAYAPNHRPKILLSNDVIKQILRKNRSKTLREVALILKKASGGKSRPVSKQCVHIMYRHFGIPRPSIWGAISAQISTVIPNRESFKQRLDKLGSEAAIARQIGVEPASFRYWRKVRGWKQVFPQP